MSGERRATRMLVMPSRCWKPLWPDNRNGMSHSYHTHTSETEESPDVQDTWGNGLLESDLIHRSGDTNRASWGSRLRPSSPVGPTMPHAAPRAKALCI